MIERGGGRKGRALCRDGRRGGVEEREEGEARLEMAGTVGWTAAKMAGHKPPVRASTPAAPGLPQLTRVNCPISVDLSVHSVEQAANEERHRPMDMLLTTVYGFVMASLVCRARRPSSGAHINWLIQLLD